MGSRSATLRAVVVGSRAPRALWVVLMVALPAGCAGSSTNGDQPADCAALCEKAKSRRCPHAEQLSCEDNCLGEDARAEATGCQKHHDASLSCSAKLDDICAAPTACKGELDAYLRCIVAYCSAHPDAGFCI
jgi:hypothetical protein